MGGDDSSPRATAMYWTSAFTTDQARAVRCLEMAVVMALSLGKNYGWAFFASSNRARTWCFQRVRFTRS